MENKLDWKKYLIVFLITAGLFLTAIYLSNYFGNRKVAELQAIQNKISLDILSSETQFSLLSELSCKNISDSVFAAELGELGSKLEWSENNLGATGEVAYLRKYYSLLQIKDYLLQKKISERCGVKSAFILYFYTTLENCRECKKEEIILNNLRAKYPDLKVYSFNYSTKLGAVEAMLHIFKIKDTELPALVVGDEVLSGFHPLEALENRIVKDFKLEKISEIDSESKTVGE